MIAGAMALLRRPTYRFGPVPMPTRSAPLDRPTFRLLCAIYALALALRLAMVPSAGIYHPDELFQYLEQAHRLIFGHGVVPWEYRYGMRSWLLPLALVPPMALGSWLAPNSIAYMILPRLAFVAASLSVVWSAWTFGSRASREHGLIAATIAAFWGEFVYLAPHILSETASIALILPAAVLITDERADARRIAAAGAMLGLALIFRMQHGPAVVALVGLALWRRRETWAALVVGGAAALLAGAIVDLAMGQAPFGWAVEYVRQNIIHNRAANYGVSSPLAFPQAIGITLEIWTFPILALAAVGARRWPILLRVAVVNLALHMAIGHKEYRFILLTTALLVLLAALGTGEIVAWAARRWLDRRRLTIGAALALWAIASGSIAYHGRFNQYATGDMRGLVTFDALRGDKRLCGLATQGLGFAAGGGYSYLHQPVAIYTYAPWESARLQRESAAFNRLIAPVFIAPPAGFAKRRCVPGSGSDFPTLCIFARPGPCADVAAQSEVNRVLIRVDQ